MPRFGFDKVVGDDKPFGEEYVVLNAVLDKLRQAETTPHIDSISSKMMQLDYYETIFGIYDHEHQSAGNPLALVRMHHKEDPVGYSKLYRTIHRFYDHQIYQKTGLTIDKFLQLPLDIVELHFKISAATSQSESSQLDPILKQLAAAQGRAGSG